ncbi:MAG TPA: hypothetical protein VES20_13020, partial [Bryobacteraceae bacterium]|nr:hypothetical protein [Bryobacteraceae bacterium]
VSSLLGGVPLLHRTDRMTAAVNSLTEQADFQKDYEALPRHYLIMSGRAEFQTGHSNEDGNVEQRHHRLTSAESVVGIKSAAGSGAWNI